MPDTARVPDAHLGTLIAHLQGGGDSTPAAALDLALDLADARATLRHQDQVRAALGATAREAGDRARKATAAATAAGATW